ncbi:MAG: hypothetical protein MR936_07100 [Eubacterium sp.]|nr:hypothetical protein [Eubacterium sp.]
MNGIADREKLEIQNLLKDFEIEHENEVSEEEIFLDLQYELYKEEISKMDLSEEDSLKPELSEDVSLKMKKYPKLDVDSSLKFFKKRKKKKNPVLMWKIFFSAIMAILLMLIVLTITVMGIYISGKQKMTDSRNGELRFSENAQAISEYQGQKITYENQIYRKQPNASHVLFIGKNTDGAYSMVLMNFNGSIGEMSAMPIPRALLNLDVTSEVCYDDMQEEVSRLLYGLPVHGYLTLDLQIAAKKTGQILSNTASDKGCTEILIDFIRQTVRNADNDMTGIWKNVEDMQDTLQWNMDVAELCYLYITAVNCAGSKITEIKVRDSEDLLPGILKTFYSAV